MEERNLTEGKILSSLLRFAVPVFFALLLQAMYGAADLLIVGKFANAYEQSAVASGSQLLNMITMVVTGLTMGVTVFVGDAIGCGKSERAGRGIGAGILLFALVALVLMAVLFPFSPVLAQWMHTPKEAFDQTSAYIRICGFGAIFLVAYNVLGAIFRGMGDSKTPLFTVAVACVINIFGDYVLVAHFGLGAAGAAIATVTAQAISVVLSFFLIRKKQFPFAFSFSYLSFRGGYVKRILWVGLPIGLQELLVQFSFLFIQVIVNGIGVMESAAVGVAEKVCMFLMLVSSAYMQSISAFVAQNNGAGRKDRSKQALRYGIETAFCAGCGTGLLALVGGAQLAAIFSNEPMVVAEAYSYLKAYAIDCLLTAVLFCMIGYFNGSGKTLFVMVQGIVGAFFVRIPVVYAMSRLADVSLFQIGLATPISSVTQIVLCLLAYGFFQQKERQQAGLGKKQGV